MSKQSYFEQFSFAKVHSLVLFDLWIEPYQVLPLWARVDLGEMAITGYSAVPRSSNITEASQSNCLVSYSGHSLMGSYPSVEKQSVYSTAPADWAI